MTPQEIIKDLEGVLHELPHLRNQFDAMLDMQDNPDAVYEADRAMVEFGRDMAVRSYIVSIYRTVVSALHAAGGLFTAEMFDETSRHTLLMIQKEEMPEIADAEDMTSVLTTWALDRLFAEAQRYIENAIDRQTSKLIHIE